MILHLDTNAYTAFKLGRSDVVEAIRHAREVVLSAVVLGELRAGFACGSRRSVNERDLAEFLASPRCRVAAVDDAVTVEYAKVFAHLRRIGRPIPTNDLWIAACTLADPLAELLTADEHFGLIPDLQTQSFA